MVRSQVNRPPGLDKPQDTEALHYAGIRTRGWHCVWGTNRGRWLKAVGGLWYRAYVSETR